MQNYQNGNHSVITGKKIRDSWTKTSAQSVAYLICCLVSLDGNDLAFLIAGWHVWQRVPKVSWWPCIAKWVTSMTTFFYDVILQSCTVKTLETSIHSRPMFFNGFWKIWPPGWSSCGPKKTHPCGIIRVLSHCASKSSHRSLQQVRQGKNKNKKTRLYISRICPDTPLQPICTNFWLLIHLLDKINCVKFYYNWLRGFNFMTGRILATPIEMRHCHLHSTWTIFQPVMTN